MANSMYVPLAMMPEDMNQLKTLISKAFDFFGLTAPGIKFYKSLETNANLLNKFIMIEGDTNDQQCWVSFSECSADISEKEGYNYIADVQTRGSWVFAGIVAYGLCQFSGYVVFNDSGQLDGQNEYTPESLRSTLISRI